MQNRLVISVHIPKTAGTTFRSFLEKAFPGGLLRDYGLDAIELNNLFEASFKNITAIKGNGLFDVRLISEGIAELQRLLSLKGIRVIHGHFDIAKYLGMFPNAAYVVWLRDPLERALSHYRFFQRYLTDPTYEVNSSIYEGRLSFDEWMLLPDNINIQCRLTAGNLSRFHFAGITEQYDRSLSIFKELFGLDREAADLEGPAENVNPAKRLNARYRVGRRTRKQFFELNQADIRLYNHAVAKLNAFRSA